MWVIKMWKKAEITLIYILVTMIFVGCSVNEVKEEVEKTPDNDHITLTVTIIDTPMPTAESTPTDKPKNPNEISSYATTIYDKNEHRVNNIKIAAEDLNHTVIEAGEVFSFNETVGKRTKEKGYEEAPILVSGEKSKGTGGGVCQVSTTLYNAAVDADLEILERHSHSKEVSYVPEGKDAAVVYGSKDMRFKNTKKYPIEILITVSEDEIHVTLNKKSE
jgi:vancomycin resistance protein YoaR